VLSHNQKWITELTAQLTNTGLKVFPSQTNFVLVEFPREAGKTADESNAWLNRNGIIPRQFAVDDFSNKLRFTVGRDWEMEKTIEVLSSFLKA
jgi:histidinol-phosphate aminotransferase